VLKRMLPQCARKPASTLLVPPGTATDGLTTAS
jgi:hypothetical protein